MSDLVLLIAGMVAYVVAPWAIVLGGLVVWDRIAKWRRRTVDRA